MDKIDAKIIGFINTFERVTRTNIKTAFLDKNNQLVFIVNEGKAGKAIGKGGSNIKKLSHLLKKRIKVVEFNQDIKEFIKSYINPLKAEKIEIEDKTVKIKAKSRQTKALLIGKNQQNIQELNKLTKKFFDCEVKVI